MRVGINVLNCSMPTIRIQTSQNIELEYALAGVGERLVAYLIDLLVYIAYGVAVYLIIDATGGLGSGRSVLILMLPVFFYQLLCELFLNGQSLGKKVKQIRVVSLNGNQPNLGQYLIRWIFRIVDDMIGGGVVAIITITLTDRSQRVGDLLAGTTVVRTRPGTNFGETIYSESDESYTPRFSPALHFSDKDISLLKQVVNRCKTDPDNSRSILLKAYEKTRDILRVEEAHEPLEFLETVIRDYNHHTGREH